MMVQLCYWAHGRMYTIATSHEHISNKVTKKVLKLSTRASKSTGDAQEQQQTVKNALVNQTHNTSTGDVLVKYRMVT